MNTMSALPPILPQLLGDTASVRAEVPDSTYEHEYADAVTWERVRLDTNVQTFDSEWAQAHNLTAVLYVDAVLSSPAEPPALRSEVTVVRGASTFTGIVVSVQELCDDMGMVHHWEVGLS